MRILQKTGKIDFQMENEFRMANDEETDNIEEFHRSFLVKGDEVRELLIFLGKKPMKISVRNRRGTHLGEEELQELPQDQRVLQFGGIR